MRLATSVLGCVFGCINKIVVVQKKNVRKVVRYVISLIPSSRWIFKFFFIDIKGFLSFFDRF